jgi:hypothetical protein
MDLFIEGDRLGRRHYRFPALTETGPHRGQDVSSAALLQAGQIRPRVINVDGHPAYAAAIGDLKRTGQPLLSSLDTGTPMKFTRMTVELLSDEPTVPR